MTAAQVTAFGLGGDLPVQRLGFGAMRITGPGIWGEPNDHREAIAVLRDAVDRGVNLIDTADSYGPFVSERLIAEALHPYPEDLVIASKGGLLRDGPNQWRPDGRPQHLRDACDGSLQRLRLEQIPLYQFHRVDPTVPFEESIGALVMLKDAGKIRHIGLSNVDEDQLDRALAMTPIVSVQNRYGPDDRSSESMLDRCEQEGIAFLPWAPLDQGGVDRNSDMARIASAHGATSRQVALAWLLARSPVMLPIPGTGSVRHLEENLGARDLVLSPQEIGELNQM
jgi:aryl-alcohol dehydrogenase-like predicted oxidoreductase